MDNLITVVSLQGQAWAVALDRSRRELQVGDTISANEMVVTAEGAQIDLQFANNQILSLIGEQEASAQALQAAQALPLSAPLTAINTPQTTSVPASLSENVAKEGHNFVQLVRIAEIIEADGFTPLTVARIQEIIKPLGMVLPERDFEQDRWKEHVSYREHGSNIQYSISIDIDVIADDDIINAAEAQRDITVTGTVGGDVKPGDKVTVTVNGKTYETTVNADGKTWNVDIPGSELVQDKTVEATVTGKTPTGETITADTERPYEVRTELPKVEVELEGAGPDGVYNESEIINGKVPAIVTLDPNTVKEGDILKVTTPNGDVLLERPVTQDDINNGVPIEVPVAPGDKTVIVEATITNPEGNTGTGRDEKPVDNITPKVEIQLEGAGPDGVYNESEIKDGKVPATVTLDKDTVKVGDTLVVKTPSGDILLERPVTQDDIDNGVPVQVPVTPGQTTVTVEATITDPAGNSSSSSDTKPVDNLPPELIGVLQPQNDADADDITLDLSKEFNDLFSGKDLTYQAADLPKGLSLDPNTGIISGKIDSSASQGGNTGTKGDYKVTITVTDPAGNSSEHKFVWTVTNPSPVATDDRQTIDEDTVATGNVIKGTNSSNSGGGADNDPDGDELKVTGFTVAGDPTVYPAGSTVTIAGVGELTLNVNGDYTFTPDKDWNGTVPEVSYTISDGEGGTADAKLNITVDPVNDAPVPAAAPPDQTNEDASNPTVTLDLPNLFDDIDGDTLTYTVKDLPLGLSFDPVTGEITGTIDKSASQGGPDGDGKYTVTITATDPDGLTAEQTFTWTVTNPPPAAANDEGDTFKTVELNINAANGVLRNDTDPDGDNLSVVGVVAGSPTDQPNTGVDSPIKGAFGTLVLQPDGSYVYTPDLSNDTVWQLPAGNKLTDTFTYTVSDGEGGFATAELVITINGQSNTPPFLTPNDENGPSVDGEITVYEKGLTAGSDPGKGHVAGGIINVSALDGLKSLTIGGRELTLAELESLNSGTPVSISVAGGTLTLTGFEPLVVTKLGVDKTIGGKLNYSYELTADQVHANGNGNNSLTLDIQLAVKDDQEAVSVPADNKLVVNVIDDVPTALDDANAVTEDGPALVSGNVLNNDTKGADGVTLTGVQVGVVAAGDHVADGNIASVITGKYGTLTLNANGTYDYQLDNNNLTVQGLGAGATLDDEVFSYTITDKDGDKSTATLTITISGSNDGVTVNVPTDHTVPVGSDGKPTNPADYAKTNDHVVFESGLTGGSKPDADATKVVSNFTLKALDGLDPTNAFSIKYKDISGVEQTFMLGKDAIEALGTTPQTITTQYGELKLNGYSQAPDGTITINYDYLLNTAPTVTGDAINDDFVITVKDKDVDTAVGTISIKIVDDAPVAKSDTAEITEDAADNTVSGNVVTNDALGADVQANPVTAIGFAGTAGTVGSPLAGAYGKLTLNADGSYTYELDNSNPAVNALKDGDTLSEEFTYTITDADGDTSSTTLTITIKGHTDGVPGLVIEDKNGADVGVNSIAENATSPVTGTFTVTAPDGLKEISVGSVTVTAAQLADLAANPVIIPGTEGTLTLTGFDPITGVVTYSYQQSGTNKNHSGGKNSVTDNFEVIVTDSGGASTTPQDLVILITDTAPVAKPDTNQVTEDSATPATGNVITGTGADDVGADDVEVTGVVKGTNTTELNADVGNAVTGDFGTLKLNANGSYSYELDNSNPIVNALKTGETLTDTFSYTIKDADGDWSTTTITITINGVTDGEPSITPVDGNDSLGGIAVQGQATVYESGLTADGPGSQSKTTTGEITVTADDGLVSVTVGGKTLTLAELNALTAASDPIVTDYGKITLTDFVPVVKDGITVGGKISYSYELTKPFQNANPNEPGHENGFDVIALQVKDASTGLAVSGQLQVNIIDDAPSIGTPEDKTVHESGLPGGSDEGVAVVTATGSLAVRVGADSAAGGGSAAQVSFAAEQADLKALNLSSGYDASNAPVLLEYVVTDSVVTAYKGAGRDEADKVFTVTITNPGSNAAGYEFTLHKPLNHGTETKLDLPFDFAVIDGDNDPANNKFTITVTDDAPAGSTGEYVLNIVEDSITTTPQNTFNTSADANADNTVISVTGGVTLKVIDDGKGGKTYTYPDGHTGAQDFYGSVTVNANGSITYVPNPNYSNHGSPDGFTYTTTNGPDIDTIKVIVNVTPVADAPSLEANKTLVTPEDTARSLELKTPVVTDKIQVPGATATTDYPERLGEITLTLTGTAIGTLTKGDGSTLISSGGVYKFVITDVADLHLNGLTTAGDATVNYVTKAEYEAIKALPAADRHENFEVEVSVDSYEVDADGKKLTDVNGANSKQTITVDVQAVTDEVVLNVKEDTTQNGVTVVISNANKTADITFDEDTSFNLTNILAPEAFKDLDGSEMRYLGLKGLPNGTTVTVDGVDYVIGQAGTPTVDFGGATGVVPAITIAGTATGLPNITITPPKDFSGDLTGIKVILGALDSDSDSSTANPLPVTDEITINLHVKPVAGDLDIKGATGNEDTAITFLTDVKVTDASTATGTLGEVITKVSFKLPAEWTPTDSGKTWTNTAGQVWTLTAPTGTDAPAAGKYTVSFEAGEYVITFDANSALTREEREEILGKFTLTPPAHSSKDVTLDIKVTSKDFSVISGGDPSAEVEVSGSLKVTVKPVAERADSSTNDGSTVAGNFDVKLNPSYVYTEKGEEDEEFNLGVDGSFKLSAGWSNEDGKWVRTGENWTEDTSSGRSEDTFALLTPYMTKDNDARLSAEIEGKLEGSVFTYIGQNGPVTIPFAGEPVKIPMQYLDTVKFTGPKDWSGVVKIKVQAGTIDYDEDDNAATKLEISGESWLTNLIIEPRADQVTLKVDTPIKTLEDTPVKLNIVPTSSDKNETFDVTISGIPKGAKITYDGVDYDTLAGPLPVGLIDNGDGTFTLKITGFDKTKQPELTPPTDSNEPINLTVKAESVDTLTYIDKDGVSQTVTHRDSSKAQELPINVEVQGVPDKPNVTIVDGKEYWEDGAEDSSAQGAATGLKVALKDLVTSMESGETKNTDDGSGGLTVDGSETITLRISDLPEGFTLTGAGPQLGAGSGTERVWVISKTDLDKVQIVVPEHYSGTVKFTVQPVVTENDNPSAVFFEKQNVSFKVKPVAEASLSVESNLLEDIIGQLSLTAVGADTNEYISAVRISAAEVTAKGLTLHAADGTLLTPGPDGFYTFTYDGLNSQKAPDVYVKGPANYSGDIKLNIGYTVTDPVADGTITAATKEGTVEHTLNFAPVTDKIDLSLGSIVGGATVGGVTTQTNPGSIKVKLNIEQKADPNADALVNDGKDTDGSEQLTHIVITGVPAGVSVAGAVETASGQWLITITGEQWSGNATLEHDLEFVVSGYAAPFTDQTITITTYSKDTGAASYEKDSVEWKLTYERADKEQENDLPTVTLAPLPNPKESEDEPFSLNKVVAGTIGVHSGDYNVTLTIRTKAGDNTTFDGMTATQVVENGETITLWTKTEKVNAGESGQAKLDQMLENIKVNTPKDANSSDLKGASAGADGKLKLDINLSVHTDGISRDAQAKPEVIITPVTDDIAIGVSTNTVDEGVDVALNITLPTNTVDGELGNAKGWTIVDGKVYIHIADGALAGQLTDALGNALVEFTGTAPDGTPAGGKLYAVDADQLAGLKFVPDATKPHQTGKLDITVLVKNQEQGAGNIEVSKGTGSVEIQQSNSGYEATITAVGAELQGKANDQLIKLNITGKGLVDAGEQIDSAFISGLPSGFTVWVGEPAAAMASNAGGGTWAIPLVGNNLPANISIKPPKNWAGTLEDLKFTVVSGHSGLAPSATEISFKLEVNPVANGVEMNPTLSFGNAGDKIELNLNASMKDPSKATGAEGDQYTELTELSLSGFPDGQKVQFFIGDSNVPLSSPQAIFDNGTWTIKGLSQSDLQNLKFLHGEGSADITVKGRTYEVNAAGEQYKESGVPQYSDWSDAKTAAINISPTVPTSGADHFLWDGTAINGFGGEDTVQLRFGDNLEAGDFAKLESIEIINMKGANSGANSITGLTAADVLDMVGADKTLTILGDSNDTVSFSAGTDWVASTTGTTTTFTNTVNNTVVNLDVILTD